MTETHSNADKVFIDTQELAKRWGKSPRTLENWRGKDEGPNYYKIGGKVLYDLAEIKTLEKQMKVFNFYYNKNMNKNQLTKILKSIS